MPCSDWRGTCLGAPLRVRGFPRRHSCCHHEATTCRRSTDTGFSHCLHYCPPTTWTTVMRSKTLDPCCDSITDHTIGTDVWTSVSLYQARGSPLHGVEGDSHLPWKHLDIDKISQLVCGPHPGTTSPLPNFIRLLLLCSKPAKMPQSGTPPNDYWISGYGLSRHIVLRQLQYFLGPSATVRPYSYHV
jgi:hypothetical protein